MRWIGLAALLTIALSGNAQATTIDLPANSPYPYQRWADQSRMPTPEVVLAVSNNVERYCVGAVLPIARVSGCASIGTNTIVLGRDVKRRAFYHELGHFFDRLVLTDPWRNEFAVLVGYPDRPWKNSGVDELQEIWANVYERCSRPHLPKHRWFRGAIWENDDSGVRLKRWQVKQGCRTIRLAATS